jgi:hypothetical protein
MSLYTILVLIIVCRVFIFILTHKKLNDPNIFFYWFCFRYIVLGKYVLSSLESDFFLQPWFT